MPVPYLNKLHKQTGKPMHELEAMWDECKAIAKKADKDSKHYWGFVVYLLKQKLGIKESLSFREFVDVENESEFIDVPVVVELPPALEPAPLAVEPPAEELTPPVNSAQAENPLACTPRNLVSALFSARDKAHQLHLRTKSFSEHVALNELYDGLLDLADQIAEVVQGKYGVMEPIVPTPSPTDSALEFIQELARWVETAHSYVPAGDTFINNLIDEVQALVYRAKYKLENLH